MSAALASAPARGLSTTPVYLSGLVVATAAVVVAPRPTAAALGVLTAAWLALTLALRPPRRLSSPALAAVMVAALLRANLAQQSPRLLAAGALATAAGLLPLAISRLRGTTFFPLPHLFGLLSAVYVATGFLLSAESRILGATVTADGRVVGLVLTAVFLAAVGVASWLVLRRVTSPGSPAEARPDVQRAVLVACAGEAAFFALTWSPAASSLGQVPTLVRAISHAAVIVLFVAIGRGMAPKRLLLVVTTIVVVEGVWGLGTSLLYNAVLLPVELLAAHVAMRRRVPWTVILIAAAIAVAGNAAKVSVRNEGFIAGSFRLDTAQAYLGTYPATLVRLDRQEVSASAERFAYSQGDLLGYLWETVPSRFARWDSQTYRLIPFSAVPRAVAPWKPKGTAANEFGRAYGLLGPNDRVTSANLPLAAEAYVNFGLAGIVGAGTAVGLLLALLARALAGGGPGRIAVASVTAALVVRGVESDSSVVFGALPWVIAALALVSNWLVARPRA